MKFLKITLLSVLTLILLSCFGNRNNPNQNNTQTGNVERGIQNERAAIDRDYEAKRQEDEDRDEVLRRSNERYSDDICEDEDRDADCKDICKDIYKGDRSGKKDCEKLSITQIEKLEELHEWLEDPDEDELEEVDFDDFDVYLNISIEPLDKLVSKYNKSDAIKFLTWLILNPEFGEVFEDEDNDDDYETLTRLLKEIEPSFDPAGSNDRNADIYKPFIKKFADGDKLMEFIIQNGDDGTMAWFLDYINVVNKDCEEEDTDDEIKKCFQVYCKIGDGIDDDNQVDWLDYDEFADYLQEDIIDEGVNKTSGTEAPYTWGSTQIDDLDDVDDWVDALCNSLT